MPAKQRSTRDHAIRSGRRGAALVLAFLSVLPVGATSLISAADSTSSPDAASSPPPQTPPAPAPPSDAAPSSPPQSPPAPAPPSDAAPPQSPFPSPFAEAEAAAAALCSGGVIDKIVIERVNVFDPAVRGEDYWAFRFVNSLHSAMWSREWMIRRVVTIRQGEPCSLDRLEEAERDLRRLEFLQDAWVDPIAREGDRVTVRVRVRDAWSTRVRLSLAYFGGVSQTSVALYEVNLLGTGTNLGWEYEKNQDRTQRTLSLISPPALPKHFQFLLLSQNNSDGKVDQYELVRPFYSLDARWAVDALYKNSNSIEKVYVGPVIADSYQLHDLADKFEVGLAPSGFRDNEVRRWYFGVQRKNVDWALAAPPGSVPNRPDLAPVRRDQVMALFRYDWLHIDFQRVQFYNRATRVEDFNLGAEVELGGGVAAPVGDLDSGGFVKAAVRRGFDLGRGSFLVTSGSFEADLTNGAWFNAVTEVDGDYYVRLAPLRTLVFQSQIALGNAVEGPKRFLLGADTGLRGYPSRSFSGESMVLLNLEHRWFSTQQWVHLLRPGIVAFLEVGGAWDGRISGDVLHPDIGIGLRLAVLRSAHGTTLHFDFGFPLDKGAAPGADKPRFTFVTANSF